MTPMNEPADRAIGPFPPSARYLGVILTVSSAAMAFSIGSGRGRRRELAKGSKNGAADRLSNPRDNSPHIITVARQVRQPVHHDPDKRAVGTPECPTAAVIGLSAVASRYGVHALSPPHWIDPWQRSGRHPRRWRRAGRYAVETHRKHHRPASSSTAWQRHHCIREPLAKHTPELAPGAARGQNHSARC